MTIQQDTVELQNLDIEIKRIRHDLKILRKQKENCEKRILSYLESTQQPGLRVGGGQVIMAQEKNRRRYKKKTEKLNRGIHILQKYGIKNSQKALEELLEEMRGSPETVRVLKIQKK